jgi:hypothetical protein
VLKAEMDRIVDRVQSRRRSPESKNRIETTGVGFCLRMRQCALSFRHISETFGLPGVLDTAQRRMLRWQRKKLRNLMSCFTTR